MEHFWQLKEICGTPDKAKNGLNGVYRREKREARRMVIGALATLGAGFLVALGNLLT